MSNRQFVAVTKTYEVECGECGIVDSRPTRALADEAVRDHLTRAHPGRRGWVLGRTYGASIKRVEL